MVTDSVLTTPTVAAFQKDGANLAMELARAWRDDNLMVVRGLMAFAGRQWVAWQNDRLQDYLLTNKEAAKVLVTDNHIMPLSNSLISRIVARKLAWSAKAISGHEAAHQQSKATLRVLKYIYETQEMRQNQAIDARNIINTGRGFMIPLPNPESRTPTKCDLFMEPLNRVLRPRWIEDGQKSPFVIWYRVYYRPLAQDIFKRKFQGMDGVDFTSLYPERFLLDQSYSVDQNGKDIVVVPEIWVHPYNGGIPQADMMQIQQGLETQAKMEISKYPKGLIFTLDMEQMATISVREWPYPYNGIEIDEKGAEGEQSAPEYPFYEQSFIRISGSGRALGAPQILMDDQMDINRMLSMDRNALNLAASPVLIAQEGSMAKDKPLTIRTGKIWWMNMQPGVKEPYFLNPPQMAATMERVRQRKVDMEERLMVREVSLGSAPSGASGVLVEQLKASDNQNHAAFFDDMDIRNAKVGLAHLKIFKRYADPATAEALFSDATDKFETEAFRLTDVDTSLDIAVVTDMFGYMTPIEREKLHNDRVLNGLETPEDAIMAIEGRDPAEAKTADMNCALWENAQMLKGIQIDNSKAIQYQDNDVHLKQHGHIMKGPQYYSYDPQVQAILDAHYATHQAKLQQDQQQQAMMASVSQSGNAARGRAQPQVKGPAPSPEGGVGFRGNPTLPEFPGQVDQMLQSGAGTIQP